MAIWAATFFFESMQQGGVGVGSSVGWSETWYKTSEDGIEATINDLDLWQYIALRKACMPNIYRLSFLRVSDTENPRRFKVANVPNGTGNINHDPEHEPTAQVQCAFLIDLEKLPSGGSTTEKVHHRRFLQRGLSASMIDGNIINEGAAFFRQLREFWNFIGNHPTGTTKPNKREGWSWGIRYLDPTNVIVNIDSLSVDTNNNHNINVTPAVADVFPPKSKLLITGIDSPPRMNKVWRYLANKVSNTVKVSVLGTSRKKIQGRYDGPGNGQYQVARYMAGPVDQYVVIGLRNKKTGRVFRQLHGRSQSR